MFSRKLALIPLLGALALTPRTGSAQASATLQFGSHNYGSEVRVYPYSSDIDGEWRTSWRRWQPVTLYNYNGRFYTRAVPGARAVAVYRYNDQYFVPPRDASFQNVDRRYRWDNRPRDEDYTIIDKISGLVGGRPQRNWGSEIVVNAYAPESYGDWRTGYRRWRPVTVYYRDNRYFSRAVPGSRAVAVYSYNGQYFLPPQDNAWATMDNRFRYMRRPTDDDYNNVRRYPEVYGQQRPADQNNNNYGPEITLNTYVPQVFGDWRTGYNQWETVTLYNYNGRYYATEVPGARPLMVYRTQGRYFLPPQDRGWDNMDRRYNYRLRPSNDDYTRAVRPPTQ
jgi:hypothetical protein